MDLMGTASQARSSASPWRQQARGLASSARCVVGQLGFHPGRMLRSLASVPAYAADVRAYRASQTDITSFRLRLTSLAPMLAERHEPAGMTGGHYFWQDLWAARKIFAQAPPAHLDVGSRIDGFVAHLLTFMSVTVVDIRPLPMAVEGLTLVVADAKTLDGVPSASVTSLSSLHAIEHFGLGRYGDPVDPAACFVAMHSLARVLAPGGRLYFAVPIGVERLVFNAHRVFAPETVLSTFAELDLISFAAVDDRLVYHARAQPSQFAASRYACGLFEFGRR